MATSKLGERVHTLRRRNGWSQTELGEKVGITMNTIARLERGEVADLVGARISRLAKVFDCSSSFLLGDRDSEGTFREGEWPTGAGSLQTSHAPAVETTTPHFVRHQTNEGGI